MKRPRFHGEALVRQTVRDLSNKFEYPISFESRRSNPQPILGGDVYAANAVVGPFSVYPQERLTHITYGTNDSEIIQGAVDSLPNGRGEVYFLPGDYYINQPLILPAQGDVRWSAAPGAIFHVLDDTQLFNTNNVDVFVLDGGEYTGNPGTSGNTYLIGGGTLANGFTRHMIQNAYFRDIHCATMIGATFGGFYIVTDNVFEDINLVQAGGGFTQAAILGYQEPNNEHVYGIFANNVCRNITKTPSAGFTAYIVYSEDAGKTIIAIGNRVSGSTGLDEYWGDTAIGVHNVIDQVHEVGDHSELTTTFQPYFVNLLPFNQGGTLAVGTGASPMPFPINGQIDFVRAAVNTAPTDNDIIVDVNKNGTTIFTTQANRPRIVDGNTVGANAAPDVVSVAAGDVLTVDIDQVGSTIEGEDLTVVVMWRPIPT